MTNLSTPSNGRRVLSLYGFIVELCIHKELAGDWRDATTITMKMRSLRERWEIDLLFKGVLELFLSHMDGVPCSELSIDDIKDFQLEGLGYKIADDDGTARVSFSCRDYSLGANVSDAILAEFGRPLISGRNDFAPSRGSRGRLAR